MGGDGDLPRGTVDVRRDVRGDVDALVLLVHGRLDVLADARVGPAALDEHQGASRGLRSAEVRCVLVLGGREDLDGLRGQREARGRPEAELGQRREQDQALVPGDRRLERGCLGVTDGDVDWVRGQDHRRGSPEEVEVLPRLAQDDLVVRDEPEAVPEEEDVLDLATDEGRLRGRDGVAGGPWVPGRLVAGEVAVGPADEDVGHL